MPFIIVCKRRFWAKKVVFKSFFGKTFLLLLISEILSKRKDFGNWKTSFLLFQKSFLFLFFYCYCFLRFWANKKIFWKNNLFFIETFFILGGFCRLQKKRKDYFESRCSPAAVLSSSTAWFIKYFFGPIFIINFLQKRQIKSIF